jgi:hypothetical protein
MTRFLAHKTKSTLIADLKANGFEFDNPELFEQTTSANGHCAIYLGRIPTTDAEGNTTFSTKFCANTTDPDSVFDTEIDAPEHPYNVFA